MGLSSDLISQFAKITNDKKQDKSDKIIYGTIKEYEGAKYVKFDGSELLTPVSSTTTIEDGERVTVMIKNHSAVVIGNVTSPSTSEPKVNDMIDGKVAEFDTVVTNKLNALEIDAVKGSISELEADNLVIHDTLTANSAKIGDLEVNNLTIQEDLKAESARIDDLEANSLTAEKADIKYANIDFANIDFANIDKAKMKEFYAESGLIQYITAEDQTVTGHLVGVTISGDLIEGNTIKAEKLVVLGEDGIYYKLNIGKDSIKPEGYTDEEWTAELQNGLLGSNIIANSITADKLSVSDLVAFDATIGGFEITNNSIHSYTKETVDNGTRGIYMDNDGQIAIGDASNYLKYYKDTDGVYKLAISANSMIFTSSGKNIEETLDEIQEAVDSSVSVEVGGQNLIPLSSNFEHDTDSTITTRWFLGDGGRSVTIGDDVNQIDWNVTTDTESSNNWRSVNSPVFKLPDDWFGKKMIISLWVYSDDWSSMSYGMWWRVYLTNGDRATSTTVNNASVSTQHTSITVLKASGVLRPNMNGDQPENGKWTRIWATVDMTNSTLENATHAWIGFICVNNAVCSFRQPKVEFGTTPTDWSPSPYDIEDDISDAMNSAGLAQSTADSNSSRLNNAESIIQKLQDSISMLVRGENGESLMTQTADGWSFSLKNVLESLNDTKTDIDNLNKKATNTEVSINNLNKSVDDLGVYTDYIKFGVDENSNPCIVLGETDSPFKVKITNSDIKFMEGTYVPASISNQSLNIEKAVITDELKQGGFVWMARENGNYGLLWKGE